MMMDDGDYGNRQDNDTMMTLMTMVAVIPCTYNVMMVTTRQNPGGGVCVCDDEALW